MSISLNGLTPQDTYQALIKIGNNTNLDTTKKVLSDGLGNDLPVEVSSTEVNFTGLVKQGNVAIPTAAQVNAKQDTLVSGTNIKTINGSSILGAGDITIATSTAWGAITGTLSSQTDLQSALNAKVAGNIAIVSATKTKVTYDSKGLVTAGADATTADIADTLNKRYVSDSQLTVLGNTSGTNTGDNAVNSLYSGLAASKQDTLISATNIKTINGSSVLGSGDLAISPIQSFVVACSDESTAITTGTAKVTFRIPYAFTLTSVRASLTTAQTSGTIFTVDINEGGTSILSTKLTIDNTEKTSTTAAIPPVISDTSLADDSEITIDVDLVGDGTAKGLKVVLIGYKS